MSAKMSYRKKPAMSRNARPKKTGTTRPLQRRDWRHSGGPFLSQEANNEEARARLLETICHTK